MEPLEWAVGGAVAVEAVHILATVCGVVGGHALLRRWRNRKNRRPYDWAQDKVRW